MVGIVLDKEVTIQEYRNTSDVGYAQKPEWCFLKTAMAKIIVKSGDTKDEPQGPMVYDRVEIILYYDGEIKTGHRIVYGGQTYKIRHMQEFGEQQVGQNVYTRLTAIKWYERD